MEKKEEFVFEKINKKSGIILGERLKRKIKDNSMDSLFIATENISNIFSNSIIDNILSTWQDNIIILDFKNEFYFRNHFTRKDIGEMMNFSEEDLHYNPFLFVGKTEDYFERDIFREYTDVVTEMYEITEKYFKMDNTYKSYVIDLIISAIYFLKENKEKVNIENLINIFSSKKGPFERGAVKVLENTINVKIYKPIVNFLNLESYSAKDRIKSSIINILKIFENDDFYISDDYENEEIKKIFDEEKYTLFISLDSLKNKLSKVKIKFLINQILKNRKRLKNKTLFILPDFEILNDIPELKEMLFYNEEHGKIKLLLAGNILNLLELEENILEKRKTILDSESFKKLKKLKYFKRFSIGEKLEKHELLYMNNSIPIKINRINCKYEEKYVIKQCLKYTIIILLICLYSNLRFNF